ncbi:MAG TPA: hypothetical protein VFG33_23795 [Kribbella sp.]|uniref:hypothetical protein n=1 Tax=Kribbella sp. TaxID=1871183 RepID=UPI002D782C87|nr:hypothetical protein [Kribbella sp.]HET6296429.1 hypothetical protein [Kribbella sp.]
MKRFVVPPSWPTPPRRSWMPPKTWHPDPTWPPAPEDWQFWVDGKGNAVRGPVGLYGGTSRRKVFAGAGALVLFLAVNFWALSAIGLFDGESPSTQAAPVVDDSSPTPSTTPSAPPTTAKPSTPPTVAKTVAPKTTPTPSKTRTTKKTESAEEQRPTATKTTTKKPVPTTRPTPSRPPTQEEMYAEFCKQQGWDPEWCNPDNWPDDPDQTAPPRRP